jgi:antitoxin ParD1/3/4
LQVARRPGAPPITHRNRAAPVKFGEVAMLIHTTTMNISLPDALDSFVDEQVNERGDGTEYLREPGK